MKMNKRLRGVIADRRLDLPVIQDQNTGIEKPAMPLSLMERVAEWLYSPPEEVHRIKPANVPTYTKGKYKDLDQIRPPDQLLYFDGQETAEQRKRISRVIGEIEFRRSYSGSIQFDDEDDPISEWIGPFDLPKSFNKKYPAPLINLGRKYPLFVEDTDSDLDQIQPFDQSSYFNRQETTEQRQRISRVNGEIELLQSHFGRVKFDKNNPTSVQIERFDLPRSFNKRHSELVIDLGYKYPSYPPRDWYLSRGLRKKGRKSSHYFEDGYGAKPFCERGFAWYSFHIKRWRPNSNSMIAGDNLLTAVQAFYEALRSD